MDFALRPSCYQFISNHHRPVPVYERARHPRHSVTDLPSTQPEATSIDKEATSKEQQQHSAEPSTSLRPLSKVTPKSFISASLQPYRRRLNRELGGSGGTQRVSRSAPTLPVGKRLTMKFEEDFREDLVSWFVSFLKSISLRLSPEFFRFFCNEVSLGLLLVLRKWQLIVAVIVGSRTRVSYRDI